VGSREIRLVWVTGQERYSPEVVDLESFHPTIDLDSRFAHGPGHVAYIASMFRELGDKLLSKDVIARSVNAGCERP